ncbi:unnamed protein product [Miscanthus lutarioriparius]|uniref:Uncharacterized protein n=1 Tax=Miscanthus lutarioriparius TaxID=422564 RepID=A0A811SH62_9POAL|nr:unnamed protein product [Miscanthus lutarioriparius]
MAAVLVVETLHMVPGDGDTSYARNSTFSEILFPSIQITNVGIFHASTIRTIQSGLQSKLKPMIEEAVASLLNDNGATANAYSGGMAIADLGCSSGPNTLALVSTAVDAVRRRCSELQQQPLELCIHLNDLPSNDASEDLVRNGIPFYDRDEAVRRARRSTVIEAYARQFNDDFTRILHMRAQEISSWRPDGFLPSWAECHSVFGIHKCHPIHEMASKGLIDNEKLDSFYVPLYGPSEKELREIIEAEGSFSINKMAIHEYLDQNVILAPKTIARALRAIMEPIIAQHFGPSADAMDEFLRITDKLIEMSPLDEFPSKSGAFVAASLTRRT